MGDYKKIYSCESTNYGVQILVNLPDEMSPEEKQAIRDFGDKIMDEVEKSRYRNDPLDIRAGLAQEKELLALFEKPIFAERIPNEYWGVNSPYSINHPWFLVTTNIGHIKIGWRKRVINIDWSNTLLKDETADKLFPNENVTKGDNYIHAWGYEKAKEYINILHKE